MDNNTRHQIKEYLMDYLKKTVPGFTKKGKMITCPFQQKHAKPDELSANIYPENSNKVHCFDPNCNYKGDIFDICRQLEFEGDVDVTDDDIGNYLTNEFKITTDNTLDKLFDGYVEKKWCMVPVEKNQKESWIEKEWHLKDHYEKTEWFDWIYAKRNLGVQTGKKSNMFILDIDAMPKAIKDKIYEKKASKKEIDDAIILRDENIQKVYKVLGINDKDTLAEPTFGGVHLVFEYDSDIPKCKIIIDGVGVDVETDGGQVVIEPSIVYGYDRKFNNNKIIKLPDNIKKLILEQKGTKKEEPKQDNIILSGSEDELTFEKLRGNRSNTIIQLAGVLRKIMPAKNVKFTLNLFNNLLDKKLPQGELSRLFEQMEKYYVADSEQLKKDVVDFLVRHNEASIKDLIDCLGADKNDMLSALSDLIQDNKIFKQKHMYKTIEKAEWKTAFIEESKILPYNTPYFHNYVTLRRGDMICLGAKTGIGKGHISLNIIKKLVEDGVKPKGGINYLSSEPGNRFASIAMSLGLKEGDFRFANNYNPERLELEDDAITIVDWLLPSEYNLTAHLYKIFAQQLDRHGGLCYIFSQLKENGDFYAEPMVKFYASLAVKYFYGTKNGTVDNINTFFESVKARESKIGHQYFKIPTRYDVDTKLLELK